MRKHAYLKDEEVGMNALIFAMNVLAAGHKGVNGSFLNAVYSIQEHKF